MKSLKLSSPAGARLRRLMSASAATALFFNSGPAQAADNFWNRVVDSFWNASGNWTGGVPTSTDDAKANQGNGLNIFLDDGSSHTINSYESNQYLYVSNSSSLTILGSASLTGTSGGPYAGVYVQDSGSRILVGTDGFSTPTGLFIQSQADSAALNGGYLGLFNPIVANHDGGQIYALGTDARVEIGGPGALTNLQNYAGGLVYAADNGIVQINSGLITTEATSGIRAVGTGTFLESQVFIGLWDGTLNNSGNIGSQDGGYVGISAGGATSGIVNNLAGGLIEASTGGALTLYNGAATLDVINHEGGTFRASDYSRLEMMQNGVPGGRLTNRGVVEAYGDFSTLGSGGYVNLNLATIVNDGGLITAYDNGKVLFGPSPGLTDFPTFTNRAHEIGTSIVRAENGGEVRLQVLRAENNAATVVPGTPLNAAVIESDGAYVYIETDDFVNSSHIWNDDAVSPGIAKGMIRARNGGYLYIAGNPASPGASTFTNYGDVISDGGGLVIESDNVIQGSFSAPQVGLQGGLMSASGGGTIRVSALNKFENHAGGTVSADGTFSRAILQSPTGYVKNEGVLLANAGGSIEVDSAQFIQNGGSFTTGGGQTIVDANVTTGSGSLTEAAHSGSVTTLTTKASQTFANSGELKTRENGKIVVSSNTAKNYELISVLSTGEMEFVNGLKQLGSGAITRIGGTLTAGGSGLTLGNAGDAPGTGGLLAGYGTVVGTVTNNSGIINAGGSPGKLTIDGELHNKSAGEIIFEIAGNSQGVTYDWLNVLGDTYIDGTLNFWFDPNFAFGDGSVFNVLTAKHLHFGNWRYTSNTGVRVEQFQDGGGFGLRIVTQRDPGGPAVPEPGAVAQLIGCGVFGFMVMRRRRD